MSSPVAVSVKLIRSECLALFGAVQVSKVRQIIESLGLQVATPDEAREILSLKGGDQVNF